MDLSKSGEKFTVNVQYAVLSELTLFIQIMFSEIIFECLNFISTRYVKNSKFLLSSNRIAKKFDPLFATDEQLHQT